MMGGNPRYIYQAAEKWNGQAPTYSRVFAAITSTSERGDDSSICSSPHCASPQPQPCDPQNEHFLYARQDIAGNHRSARGKSAAVKGYQAARAGFARG